MQLFTRFNTARTCRYHRIEGGVSLAELKDALGQLYAQPEIRAMPLALWDLREAHLSDLTYAEVDVVATFVTENWQGARSALLVAGDSDYGMSRMYDALIQAHGSSGRVRLFRDAPAAELWLGEMEANLVQRDPLDEALPSPGTFEVGTSRQKRPQ